MRRFPSMSAESVLVCLFIGLMYKVVWRSMEDAGRRSTGEDEDLDDKGIDLDLNLSQLPDCYVHTDKGKTARILQLEHELATTNNQLIQARNELNNLYTEVDRYKRVHGQVGWLIEQFRRTITGDKALTAPPQLQAILPPPPPPSLLPEGPSPADTVDLVTPDSSQDALTLPSDSLEDADGSASDWETTDEADTTVSGLSVQTGLSQGSEQESLLMRDIDMADLLVNVDTRTHISEIFRRFHSTLQPLPPTPPPPTSPPLPNDQ